jgi:hypothetical protein
MSTDPGASAGSEASVEIGPPPYYHRADCHICRKQDGLKTGSALLDAPRPGGVPRKGEGDLRGLAYLAQRPPLTSAFSDAEAMSRKIRADFEASEGES